MNCIIELSCQLFECIRLIYDDEGFGHEESTF